MNPHEELARTRKAYALADVLERAGVDAESLPDMPSGVWSLAVAVVEQDTGRTMSAPSTATQLLVLDVLRRRWAGKDELARRREVADAICRNMDLRDGGGTRPSLGAS